MAATNHWISDVFPVQYTVEDALGEKIKNDTKTTYYAKEKLKDLYEADQGSLIKDINTKEEDNLPSGNSIKRIVKEEKCLWTKEELDIFRNGYFTLKRRAVHLLILLSDSKARNGELRKKCKNKDIIITNQGQLLSAQKKEIVQLKTTIKELQKDLGFSEKKLQQLLIIEAQLKDQSSFLKTELEEERKQTEKLQAICRDLTRSLANLQRKLEIDLVEQRNILLVQYQHTQAKVEKEKERILEELEKEKQEHHLTKIALEQLRRHFVNMRVDESGKFLDVAEIDH